MTGLSNRISQGGGAGGGGGGLPPDDAYLPGALDTFYGPTVGAAATQVGDVAHIGSSLQNHNNHGIGVGSKIAFCNETTPAHTWATSVCMATGTGVVGVINSKEKQLTNPSGTQIQGIKTMLFDGGGDDYVETLAGPSTGLTRVISHGAATTFLTQLTQGQHIDLIASGGTLDDVQSGAVVRSVVSNTEFVCEFGDIVGLGDSLPWGLAIATKVPAASFEHVNPGVAITAPNGTDWIVPSPYYVWIPAAGDNLNLAPGASEGMGGVLSSTISHVDKTLALTVAYGWVGTGTGGGVYTPSIINLTDALTVIKPADPFTLSMAAADNNFHVDFLGPSTPGAYTNKQLGWYWGQTITAKAIPLYSRLFTSQATGLASSVFLGVAQGSGYHARFLQGAPMKYKTAFFSFLRQTQLQHGNTKPLILVMIETGAHTLDDSRMSVGPSPALSNTIAGEKDNLIAIIEELLDIWDVNGWDPTELHLMPWVPADIGTYEAQYALVRTMLRQICDLYPRCATFDLTHDGVVKKDLLTLAASNDGVHYASDTFNDWMMSRIFRYFIERAA